MPLVQRLSILLLCVLSYSRCLFADSPQSNLSSAPIDISKPIAVPNIPFEGIALTNSNAKATLTPRQREDEADREHRKDADDHLIAVATVQLAHLTAVLAIVAVIQIGMFIWQLVLAKAAARDSATNAKSAEKSAEALPKIERAYVFISVKVQTQWSYDLQIEGAIGKVAIIIRNLGKTPALLETLKVTLDASKERPIPDENTENTRVGPLHGVVVAAGGEHRVYYDFPLPTELIAQIRNDQKQVYAYGAVEYKDVLNDAHLSGFCWRTSATNNALEFDIVPSDPLNRYT